jgi:hypothetical protein
LTEKDVRNAFDMGVKDAQDTIAKGSAASFDDLVHYHALKKQGDQRILSHTYGSFVDAKNNGDFEKYDILKDDFMRQYTYKFLQK